MNLSNRVRFIHLYLLCFLWLQSETKCGADDVEVAGDADAVILAQVIIVLCEMFVEDLARAGGEAIAHPAIHAPVVEDFIRHVQRQMDLVGTNRMFELQPVSIPSGRCARGSKTTLEEVSIAESEFVEIEPQRDRKRETILPNAPVPNRLHTDAQKIWRDRQILAEPESKPDPRAFIDGPGDITPEAQRTQQVEVNSFGDGNCDLYVAPQLIVGVVNRLRRYASTQECQQHQSQVRSFAQFVPFVRGGGRTVKDVRATITRSPTCRRVLLASGLGRVAMIDFVGSLSGVSVVK